MNIQAQDERLQTRTPHVLIVEDDEDARSIYSDYLSRHGYHTLTAASGEQALALAQTHPLDLALLDIMMPGMSGREVAAWLRKNRPEVEIVFVTRMFVIRAHDKVDVAVEEMHRGAFYYLSKPVRLRQLLEIVEQALAKRQARALVGAQVRSGDLLVDLQRGQATLQGETLPLTSQESEVLVCLARRQGEVVSYETLCQEVWGCDDLLDKGVVQRTVSRLRDKIGEARIICHWGQGYRLA